MSFVDDGIVLDMRAHGETAALAHVFTLEHGRRVGLVYGGQGKRMRPILQAGNGVRVEWKGRGDDALGHFSIELVHARAAEAMQERLSLLALGAACATARAVLPEREAHPGSYHAMEVLLNNLEGLDLWPALMARWELGLLAEMGFGLTLDRCAATGAREDLIYVSPKSACAVSREAGEPYKDKLLPLPPFFNDASVQPSLEEAIGGLTTTGYFLETRILHITDKLLPEARARLINDLEDQTP